MYSVNFSLLRFRSRLLGTEIERRAGGWVSDRPPGLEKKTVLNFPKNERFWKTGMQLCNLRELLLLQPGRWQLNTSLGKTVDDDRITLDTACFIVRWLIGLFRVLFLSINISVWCKSALWCFSDEHDSDYSVASLERMFTALPASWHLNLFMLKKTCTEAESISFESIKTEYDEL